MLCGSRLRARRNFLNFQKKTRLGLGFTPSIFKLYSVWMWARERESRGRKKHRLPPDKKIMPQPPEKIWKCVLHATERTSCIQGCSMFCIRGYILKLLNFWFTHFEFSSFSYKLVRAVAYFTLRLKNYRIYYMGFVALQLAILWACSLDSMCFRLF